MCSYFNYIIQICLQQQAKKLKKYFTELFESAPGNFYSAKPLVHSAFQLHLCLRKNDLLIAI